MRNAPNFFGGGEDLNNSDIKVLVVDDEAEIRKILRLLLENKKYNVIEAANGAEAVDKVREEAPDLVVMDIMMPGMSGVSATAAIREFSVVPVLFLTAKSLERDKAQAYGTGGDDYLVKPFSSAELLMKIESLLRRYTVYKGKENKSDPIPFACGVELYPSERSAYKNGKRVELRDRETDILFYLFERRGEVVDTADIFETVWREKALSSSANNVMVNMLNLRKKLEDDPSSPRIIKTVWGRGYLLE